MPVSPSQDDSRCLRTRAVTTAELTLDVGEKTVKTGGRMTVSVKQKGGRKKQILQSLCLLLASGFYGRRKVENLREIDEYP